MQLSERQALKFGSIPQFTMIGLFILTGYLYRDTYELTWPWRAISDIGFLLFGYCLIELYAKKRRTKGLITNGVFRYTRHPMYTGIFLMNLSYWVPKPIGNDWLFYAMQAGFLICLMAAGWFQEKETLARFGDEAKAYYARTPRLFIWYPFMQRA